MEQRGQGPSPAGAKHGPSSAGPEGRAAKDRAEAGQWLLMRDYKAISSAMKASGGPSVTTNENK